MAFAK